MGGRSGPYFLTVFFSSNFHSLGGSPKKSKMVQNDLNLPKTARIDPKQSELTQNSPKQSLMACNSSQSVQNCPFLIQNKLKWPEMA
jgi:hypothetical protein